MELRGNRLSALGASQVAASGNVGLTVEGDGFFGHVIFASGGRWRMHPIEAQGSENLLLTLDRVANFDSHDPKPDWCLIQAGRNDSASTDHAAKIATFSQILDRLISRNIKPIVTELIPAGDNSIYNDHVMIYTAGLCNLCAQRGIPFIRFPLEMIDQNTGGLVDTYHTGDGTHLNVTGAKLFGEHIANELRNVTGMILPWEPALCRTNDASTAEALKQSNPLFLTDTNADNIPDNWTIDSTDSGTLSKALVDAAPDGVAGNWFSITKTASTADTVIQSRMSTGITPGNVWALGWAMKVDYDSGTDGYVTVDARDNVGNTMLRHKVWTNSDMAVNKQWVIVTVPSGASWVDFRLLHNLVGTFSIAQFTAIDLTAAGIDAYK